MNALNATRTNQYLSFTLAGERYAIEVSRIKEVLEYQTITRVPNTPPFMRGVTNVRGGVVPVVDLRAKFEVEITEPTIDTCIIVLEVPLDDELMIIGTIADTVEEVIELLPDQIEPAPKIGTNIDTRHIEGIGKSGEQFLLLLNVDTIFTARDVIRAADAAEETGSVGEERE